MKKITKPVQNIHTILANQDKQAHERKYLFLFLLISIIIHLFILVPLITYKTHHNKLLFQSRLKTLPIQNKLELPASLKPRKSNFGTPVFYEQTPQDTSKQIPTEPTKLPEQKQEPVKIEPEKNDLPASLKPRKSQFGIPDSALEIIQQTQKIPKQLPEPIQKAQRPEKKEQKALKEITPKITQKAVPEIKAQKTTIEKSAINIAKTNAKPDGHIKDFKEIIKERQKADTLEKIETKKAGSQDAEENPFTRKACASKIFSGKNSKEIAEQDVGASQPEPRNIIAMTKGYIENLEAKGQDWMEREGDDSKRPSFEELKYISYNQHIAWQLQSAWKRSSRNHLSQELPNGYVTIKLIIDAHGNLTTVDLLQSSGYAEMDRAVLEDSKRASPFPPLPKHFKTETYVFCVRVHVITHDPGF
ncbi:MAG: energy transducer TonB [bacterium]